MTISLSDLPDVYEYVLRGVIAFIGVVVLLVFLELAPLIEWIARRLDYGIEE